MLQQLSIEMVASGIVGLVLFGMMVKRAIEGYIDTRRHMNSSNPNNSMVTAMSVSWDRDQQERLLQMIERIADSLVRQADSQEQLVSRQQHDMQTQLDYIVKRMDNLSGATRRTTRSKK